MNNTKDSNLPNRPNSREEKKLTCNLMKLSISASILCNSRWKASSSADAGKRRNAELESPEAEEEEARVVRLGFWRDRANPVETGRPILKKSKEETWDPSKISTLGRFSFGSHAANPSAAAEEEEGSIAGKTENGAEIKTIRSVRNLYRE